MQETQEMWVQSLGWEDPLKEGTATHSSILSMEFSSKNIGVGCHSLLQGIFPTEDSNLDLLHCRQIL